jgi:hypothetical protein
MSKNVFPRTVIIGWWEPTNGQRQSSDRRDAPKPAAEEPTSTNLDRKKIGLRFDLSLLALERLLVFQSAGRRVASPKTDAA